MRTDTEKLFKLRMDAAAAHGALRYLVAEMKKAINSQNPLDVTYRAYLVDRIEEHVNGLDDALDRSLDVTADEEENKGGDNA